MPDLAFLKVVIVGAQHILALILQFAEQLTLQLLLLAPAFGQLLWQRRLFVHGSLQVPVTGINNCTDAPYAERTPHGTYPARNVP